LLLGLVGPLGASCAHKTGLEKQLADAEHKANEAESLIMDAEKQMDALEPGKASEELTRARADLADPDIGFDPDAQPIKDRLVQAERRLPLVRKQREKRDLERAVSAKREELEKDQARLAAALLPLRAAALTSALLAEAKDSEARVEAALASGKELEPKDASYAEWVRQLKQKLAADEAILVLGQKRLDFIAGPVVLHANGAALIKQGRATKASQKRSELYQQALVTLQQFEDQARAFLSATPALAKAPIEIEGKPTTPSALLALSQSEMAGAKKLLGGRRKHR
jgi:hypothetical protein